MRKDYSIWLNETGGTGKRKMNGEVTYCSVIFPFTLNEVSGGNYRGRMRLLSPRTGEAMIIQKEQHFAKAGGEGKKPVLKSDYRQLNLRAGVSKTEMEAYLVKTAKAIYADNIRFLLQQLRKSVRPDEVDPITLGELYGGEFIQDKYAAGNRTETLESKHQMLREMLQDLRQKPICKISSKSVNAAIKSRDYRLRKMLYDFFLYCLERNYCEGPIPMEEPILPQVSDTRKQNKAKTITRVPDRVLERLEPLLLEDASGADCGIALMASGFGAKLVCTKLWGDVIWDSKDPLYVRIRLDRPDVSCAIHNYTRPVIPPAAEVLHKRYESLSTRYTDEELAVMPIVSQKTNPGKKMESPALIRESKVALLKAGLDGQILTDAKLGRFDAVPPRLLQKTYEYLLVTKCGLNPEEGTYKFLLGQSISGDTTSTNYVSFTSPAGQRRLYLILKVLQRKRKLEEEPLKVEHQTIQDCYRISPENTDEWAGMTMEAIVQPGEQLILHCPHGIEGIMRSRFSLEGGLFMGAALSGVAEHTTEPAPTEPIEINEINQEGKDET